MGHTLFVGVTVGSKRRLPTSSAGPTDLDGTVEMRIGDPSVPPKDVYREVNYQIRMAHFTN